MRSINDMIRGLVEDEWNEVLIDHGDHHSSQPVITELELDPSMPEIYPLTSDPVFDAIGELFGEIYDHTESTRRKVKTAIQQGLQFVYLAWNGEPLDMILVSQINQAYKEGSHLSALPYRSGTRRAGFFLNLVGGSVMIENYEDGIYVARNVILLPIT